MGALLALAAGVAVVIGGIVVLRQHAFVALLTAGLVVGLLTGPQAIFRSQLRGHALSVISLAPDEVSLAGMSDDMRPGEYDVYRPQSDGGWQRQTTVTLGKMQGNQAQFTTSGPGLHRGDVLVNANEARSAQQVADQSAVIRLVAGFGETCRKIGILIAMASIVGICLLESGAAARIVDAISRGLGEKRTPAAFAVSGFTLGIPVFFDTVFFLLIPLAKALYRRTQQNYLLYVLAVVVGATMAHSLIPPTPGPLFVAEELQVNLGLTILCGLAVGIICSTCGYGYAWWLDRRFPVRPTALQLEEMMQASETPASRPPLGWALLPIVLPVLLLGSVGIVQFIGWESSQAWLNTLIETLGDRNVALSLAAAVALVMLYRAKGDAQAAQRSVQTALSAGGVVILITAAGGAFGQMIRQTDIASEVGQWMPQSGSGTLLLVVAFGITALVRIAQGSATVAMITAVGIVGPLASSMSLPFHPVYLVMAIGCGSKPLPWMNDSGFWVVGRMSGLTPGETLRGFSGMLTVMGLVGLGVTLLAAQWLPLTSGSP